jgi:hypothetical protein
MKKLFILFFFNIANILVYQVKYDTLFPFNENKKIEYTFEINYILYFK